MSDAAPDIAPAGTGRTGAPPAGGQAGPGRHRRRRAQDPDVRDPRRGSAGAHRGRGRFRILEEVGIDFRGDPDALRLWREAGAEVEGERRALSRGPLAVDLRTAPSAFVQHARNPERSLKIGGDTVVFAPAYGSPFVQDLEGGRRYGTLADFEDFVKLAYAIPWLHHSGGTVCEPVDIPVNKRHLDMVAAHLRFSDKPFMGSVTSAKRARATRSRCARIALRPRLRRRELRDPRQCQRQLAAGARRRGDPASPHLRARPIRRRCACRSFSAARWARSPRAGGLAQCFAEALFCVALGQLERPGSPAILGNFLSSMSLRSGADLRHAGAGAGARSRSASSPAASASRSDVRRLQCGSKLPDGQAATESTDSLWPAFLAGANFMLHAAGWLEAGLTMGYEKFVMDLDFCAASCTSWRRAFRLDDNAFALDAFREIGPGQAFLRLRPYARQLRDRVLGERGRRQQFLRAMARRGHEGRADPRRRPLQAAAGRVRAAEARSGRGRRARRFRRAPEGRAAGPVALMALSTAVIAYETEEAARRRLEAFGYSAEIAAEIAVYLAQSTDLPQFEGEITEALAHDGIAAEFVSLDGLAQRLRDLAPQREETIVWALTDGVRFYRGSSIPALARLEGFARVRQPGDNGAPRPGQVRQPRARSAAGLAVPPTLLMEGEREIGALGDWAGAFGTTVRQAQYARRQDRHFRRQPVPKPRRGERASETHS